MRFFTTPRPTDESLLWSRDIRFVHRLAETLNGGRLLELESGICLIAPAAVLTDARATEVARANRSPEYGLVRVDRSIPAADRYLVALASAVQISGIADRIGMGSSVQVALFVAPALVLISLATAHRMDFVFQTFVVVAVALATVIVTLISRDGKSNWLEGAQLVGAYVIMEISFLFVRPG